MTSLRNEFRVQNFGLNNFRIDVFYTAQWQWPAVIFILYRLLVTGYTLAILFLQITAPNNNPYPVWAYLTSWTYFMLVAHLLVATVITLLHNWEKWDGSCDCQPVLETEDDFLNGSDAGSKASTPFLPSSDDEGFSDIRIYRPRTLPGYMKLSWVLFAIVANAAPLVTILYFVGIYPVLAPYIGVQFGDFNLHAVNTIIVFLELVISAIPVRIYHVIYPFLYGMLYIAFSLIYWSTDHTNVIYPVLLDWNFPIRTSLIVVGVGLLACPIFQIIIYTIYRIRMWIYNKVYGYQ